jgi:hypothetical protein
VVQETKVVITNFKVLYLHFCELLISEPETSQKEATVLTKTLKCMESPFFALVCWMVDISAHTCILQPFPQGGTDRQFTCTDGAGDGLFNKLVNSGEVGVGAIGLTSGGVSLVSSPIT